MLLVAARTQFFHSAIKLRHVRNSFSKNMVGNQKIDADDTVIQDHIINHYFSEEFKTSPKIMGLHFKRLATNKTKDWRLLSQRRRFGGPYLIVQMIRPLVFIVSQWELLRWAGTS